MEKSILSKTKIILGIFFLSLILIACDKDGDMEEMGEEADKMMQDASEKMEEMSEDMKEEIEKKAKAAKEAMED